MSAVRQFSWRFYFYGKFRHTVTNKLKTIKVDTVTKKILIFYFFLLDYVCSCIILNYSTVLHEVSNNKRQKREYLWMVQKKTISAKTLLMVTW